MKKSQLFSEIIYALGIISTNLIIHSHVRENKENLALSEKVLFNNMYETVKLIQEIISEKYDISKLKKEMLKADIFPKKWKEISSELNKEYKEFKKNESESIEGFDPQYYS